MNTPTSFARSGSALVALVSGLIATQAAAQSNETQSPARATINAAAPGRSADPGEIVVTAQFRSQNLQDTPIAITAVPAAALQARSQTSVIDLGTYSPNVNLSQATSLNSNSITAFIRGIGQSDSSFALEPGVGIYVDDVYYGTTFGANLDLTDLDRVEVLRGPQGTLAGKNSVGGSVKLFSRKPDGEGGGFVEATYGRFNRIDARASADFAIGSDLFARLSLVSKHVGGYFDQLDYGCVNPDSGIPAARRGKGCKIGSEGGIDVKALRLTLRYAPAGSPLEINVVGDVTIDDSEAVTEKLIYASNPGVRSYVPGDPLAGVPFDSRFITGPHDYSSYATFLDGGNYTTVFGVPTQSAPGNFQPRPKSTAHNFGFAGTIDYELNDTLSLKSITAYRQARGTSGIDLDGSPLNVVLEEISPRHRQFTQELRLSGTVGDLVDFTVGGFYYKANDRLISRINIPQTLFDFVTDDPISNRSVSGFGHFEVHPVENFNIIGGIRYTNDRKTYTFSRRNVDGSAISGIPLTGNFTAFGLDGLSNTFKGERVDYRIGANYRWSDALMTYAQVSTGYKGGGINPRPYVPDQITTFGPEKLTSYEAGFKADLLDRALRLNGAVFYNDYKDLQLLLTYCSFSVSTACFLPANAGSAHVRGAELEASLRPVRGLTIDGSVGYLDFDYTDVDPATDITLDMKGPFNNKWQASASIQYAADLGDSGTITPRLDWAYQSSFYFSAVNNDYNKVEGRSLFNARLSYETADEDWMVSASVTNLFDKFYYTGKSENIIAYGVALGTVGRPREWALTVRRRF